MTEDVFSVYKEIVFDHMKYVLPVCVWQREVDYSLYILEDLCVQ